MKLLPFVVSVVLALLLVGSGPLRADDPPEARFAAMSPDEIRAYERETLRRVADLALIPPVPNTEPLPQYDYDKLDYGMTIGIERTPKGRLWACWVAGGDSPKAFFVLATSDDDGETWSKPRLVLDSHSRTLPRDRSILVGNLWTDPRGRLWLFFDQSMEMFDGRGGLWVTVCENPDADKPAWSSPRRIWHGVMLNKPTVLSTGEWMLPVSLDQQSGSHPAERGKFGPFQGLFPELDPFRGANVFVSTDEGATWQRRGGVAFPNPDWHEHMIVERRDGSLWMLARTTKGIMQSTSTDGGRTWAEPTEPAGIRQPNARFHVRRLGSGKLLLVKHGDRIDAHEGRVKLSAWLSDDDGATWQGGLVLDERPGISYPDGFQAPDGTIYISYDRNRDTDGEILLARFTEADVLAKQLTGPKSKLKMLISRPLAPRRAAHTPPVRIDAVGDWRVRVTVQLPDGQREAELDVPPADVVAVVDERHATLANFDPAGQPWQKGPRLAGVLAAECSVRGAVDPESIVVRDAAGGAGRTFVRGTDYEADLDWGSFGRLPGGVIAADQPVFVSYRHGLRRLDSIVLAPDGSIALRPGRPHVVMCEPLTVLAWGDSVTTYGRWQSMFIERLRERFPAARIELVTEAWGGRNTGSYLAEPPGSEHNYREKVLDRRPHLVISEFVNDANLSPEQVEERYGRLLGDFRGIDAEWIILTPHYVMPSWMGLESQQGIDDDPRPYVKGVREFGRRHGVAVADASLRYGRLWRRGIPYQTLMENDINHPNVFGHTLFADSLLSLFP